MSKGKLSRELQIKFLKNIEILSSLSEIELNYLIRFARFQTITRGKVLFNQGDAGEELHIILAGEIGISIDIPGGLQKEIIAYTTGAYFGEMSIFENAPRSAKAYAKKESVLLTIDALSLQSLMDNHPQTAVLLMHKMLKISTGRLKDTNKFVAEIVRWGDEARQRAIIDKSTGLYNRRYYDEILTEMFQVSEKTGSPLSIVMADLDNFRKINETYGLDTGDEVINQLVSVVKNKVRESDVLVRYGGDEFAFLLPATNLDKACEVMESIRQEVETLDMTIPSKSLVLNVTISVGIAAFPENSRDLNSLSQMADQALYQAKDNGRNLVLCKSD